MATAWVRSVMATKEITVFRASNASGTWPTILGTAIMRFNDLSQKLSLGVTVKEVRTAPDPNNLNGANVQFATANGSFTFQGMGAQGSGTLSGTANLGITRTVVLNGECAKSFIFLPARSPHHDFMKICMTVHEFIHATGLSNDDHSSDADPDVFCSSLTPAGAGVQCGLFANRAMPPIWMTLRTARKIQTLWVP